MSIIKNQIEAIKNNPLRQIEAQLGFTIGIFVGALGAGIVVIFFTDFAWYLKLISFVGEVGILGNLVIALIQLFSQRKGIIEMQKQFEEMGKSESLNTIVAKEDKKKAKKSEYKSKEEKVSYIQ